MTDEERAIFHKEVRACLLDNPEFIMEAAGIEARMDSDEISEEIQRTCALAQRRNITGTPTFALCKARWCAASCLVTR